MTSTISTAREHASRLEPLLLVDEISHRVVNELTVAILSLSNEARQIADTDARVALQRVAARLGAFANAHRVLQSPEAVSDLDLGDYLNQLLVALSQASLRDHRVTLALLDDDISLAPARCWRVGLIVAELVTNVVKHGRKGPGGEVIVELGRVGDQLHCIVSDNGGAASNYDPVPSRGRRVVECLADELAGDIHWSFRPAGVTVLLSFPLMTDARGLS